MTLSSLHRAAREIFDKTLKSVDAYDAVRRAVHLERSHLMLGNTILDLGDYSAGIYAVAIGKAALPMASALDEILGLHLTGGLVCSPEAKEFPIRAQPGARPSTNGPLSGRWRLFEGGHPLPNRASLDSARAAMHLLRRADAERAPVIFLISGGGSALIESPRDPGTTLQDLRAANEMLISSGATILEINSVRRSISAIKGGALAEIAPNSDQLTLIVSDTNTGEEAAVASGPSLSHPPDSPDAASVVSRYGLERALPASILRAIRRGAERKQSVSTNALRNHYVLLDNQRALASAAETARSHGFTTAISDDLVEQPVAEGCSIMLSQLLELFRRRDSGERGVCLISGGEFACPVRGRGLGGRNAELALRWAIEVAQTKLEGPGIHHVVALSAGTDGIDGNSPAAGALCDETTVKRARHLDLDANRFLEESDAYTFFRSLGDSIITGPTGTNVRDLRIMIAI